MSKAGACPDGALMQTRVCADPAHSRAVKGNARPPRMPEVGVFAQAAAAGAKRV
jgi:transposase